MAKYQFTACDIKDARDIFMKVKLSSTQLKRKIDSLTSEIQSGSLQNNEGISFLAAKNQLLGQYNLDIVNVVLRKVSGLKLEGSECVNRLIQVRTYLERVRPLKHKLKYQIEKLIKIALAGGLSKDDPLHLKPRPDNMQSKLDEAESESSDDHSDQDGAAPKKKGVYKPPMMSSAHYEENLTSKEKQQAAMARAKKRALSTAMMRELRAEYQDGPEEIRDDMNLHRIKHSQEDAHKVSYEEDNFVRLNVDKKERIRQRQLATDSSLKELAKFGDISALVEGDNFRGPSRKKSSTKAKGKKGSKKRRK